MAASPIAPLGVVNSAAFDYLFPAPGPGAQLDFNQEKRGSSESTLEQGDQTRGWLAISDTIPAPTGREIFAAGRGRLQRWPLAEQGGQATALLMADRVQVKGDRPGSRPGCPARP